MSKKTYPRVVELLNGYIPGKITRNEFCRITGVNRNSVDRYMAGLGCPSDETLQKLAKYFDKTLADLRGEGPEVRMLMTKGGMGGGVTPPRIVELLTRAVAEKSQCAVARESGLALLTVQRYLKGVGEPTNMNLQRLADYFDETFIVEIKPRSQLDEYHQCQKCGKIEGPTICECGFDNCK